MSETHLRKPAKAKGAVIGVVLVAVLSAAGAALLWLKPDASVESAQTGAYPYVSRTENGLPVLDITVFQAPSYSVWLPTLIRAKGFDETHGFRLNLTEKPGPAAYMDVASGADYACLCIAPTTFTPFIEQGADVTVLFNIFSYTNLVAVTDPSIRTAHDLEGRTLAVNTSTGAWAVSKFLLGQAGVDLEKLTVQSSSGAGASVAELAAHRVDAILPGPVEVASLSQQAAGFRTFTIFDAAAWQKVAPGAGIPNVLLGVQRKWWSRPENKALTRQFYAANLDAAAFARGHPQEAAKIIGDETDMPEAAVLYALTNFPEIINIRPASEFKNAIAVISQKLMPEHGSLARPLTHAEVDAYVSDFIP